MRNQAIHLAESIRVERYPDAKAFFLGGSLIRGEFHHVHRPSGLPSLPTMVLEGVELREASVLSTSLKRLARSPAHRPGHDTVHYPDDSFGPIRR